MNPWEMFNADGSAIDTQEKMPWEMFNQDGTARDTSAITPEEEKPSLVDTWKRNRDLREAFEKPEEASTEPSLDLIGDHLGTDSLEVDKLNAAIIEQEDKDLADSAQRQVAAVEALHNRYSTMGNQLLGFVDEESRIKYEDATKAMQDKIIKELKAGDIDAQYIDGQLYVANKDGDLVEVDDPSFIQSLYRQQYEIGGAMAGAYLGAKAAPMGPWGLGKLAGGIIGGAIGAGAGSGVDALINNIDLVNKASADIILDKMVDAGVADAVLAPLGLAVGAAAAPTIRAVKKVYDFILAGNREGAQAVMKTQFDASQAEVDEVVKNVESLLGELPVSKRADKELLALTLSRPGGEEVIAAANIFNPSTSAKVSSQIFRRAEDLVKATEELATTNNLHIFTQSLDAYTKDVKNYYKTVKEAPDSMMQDFRFDFDKVGIQPLIESIGARIENPALKQRFANTMVKVEQAAEGRTFGDLIDLRQTVNDIKYNRKQMKYSDAKALDDVIKTIDNEIEAAAKTHIPNSDTWLKSWNKANVEYAQMKELEKNQLFKALTKKGISEADAVNSLNKYIRANDDTFYEVMSKLPKDVQGRLEGSVLNKLVDKYAIGSNIGRRAIEFPKLAQEMNTISWSSPKARQLTRTINKMAEVFKNDVNLARASGRLEIPTFQSYLTTDPVARMKYEVASGIFNYVKMLVPNEQANNLAMIKLAGKVFENPMEAKATKDLLGRMPKDKRTLRERLDFEEQLLQMKNMYYERQQAIKQMFDKDAPPRLAWKADPAKLADVQNPPSRILPTPDEVLYGTVRGRVGANASEVNLSERADDLITEFIWQNTKGAKNDEIVAKAMSYMDDKRFNSIMKNASQKLQAEDAVANAKRVADSIRSEAGILISRIEKDFGVKLPKEEAEKIVAIKFKEIMEKYNVK